MNFVTEQRKFTELFKSIPKRILELCIKILGIKGVVLGISIWLIYKGKLDSWAFVVIIAIVIAEKGAMKFLENLRVNK
jgi:hypothetical protein